MNKYNINGKEAIVLDGKLFVEADPVVAVDGEETRKKIEKVGRVPRRGGKRNRLGQEAREAMIKDIKAGKTVKEIVEEYEVSAATYYSVKKSIGKDKEEKKLVTYRCGACGVGVKSFKNLAGNECFKCGGTLGQ